MLLHALAQCRHRICVPLHAVHIDHGLNPLSPGWAEHCRQVCGELEVALTIRRVDARARPDESPEEAARRARYQAFRAVLGSGDWLCTAHHQDDQAETLLLHLMRGAGPRGLAAMRARSSLGDATLVRPLLAFGREALAAYARDAGLCWIDDPSNDDIAFDRNFVRLEVMPLLRRRWPAAARTLSRSAAHCREADDIMNSLALQDLAGAEGEEGTLLVSRLLRLEQARRVCVLRVWLARLGLPVPTLAQLHHIQTDVLATAPDANPCVQWPGARVRRYRDRLYAMPPVAAVSPPAAGLPWNLRAPLALPNGQRLAAIAVAGRGLSAARCRNQVVSVRFRQGGEHCRPAGGRHSRSLKNLFQEQGIPPWRRDVLPLIYVGESLACVVGLCVCEPFATRDGDAGYDFVLLPPLPDGDNPAG